MEIVAYALLLLCLATLMGFLVYAIHGFCASSRTDRPPRSDKAEKRLKQQERGHARFEVELKVLNTEVLYCKVEKARTLEPSRNKDETTGCEKETQ
jgi:hypothetical protein